MTETSVRLKAWIAANPWGLLGFFAAAVTFVVTLHPLLSPDVFMYVAIADEWIRAGSPPKQDPFLIAPKAHFQIMHEWLSYFVFWLVHRIGGFDATILMKCSLFAGMSVLITRTAAQFRTNWVAFVLAFGLALTSAHFRTSERTSLFSDLFQLICLLAALEIFTRPRLNLRVSCVFAFVGFALWTNLHPGWLFGLLLLVIGAAARTIGSRGLEWKSFAIALAAGLGLFVHPEGVGAVTYPFEFSGDLRKLYQQYYVEWAPVYVELLLNFIEIKVFLVFSTIGSALAVGFSLRRSWLEGMFVGVLVALMVAPTFMHSRFIVVSSIGLAMIICFVFREGRAPNSKVVGATAVASLLTAAIFIVWPFAKGTSPVRLGFDETLMPTTSIEALAALPPGNVFNSHEFGGVIAWKFQGRYKVIFHGFDTEIPRFVNDFMPAFENELAVLKAINKYQIRYFLLDRHGSIQNVFKLIEKHGWKVHHYDSASVLLVGPNG